MRRLSGLPRSRAQWRAVLTLQRPRRAQLRTRVLAGVLAVTVIALVAFDFAAVGALRRYLVGHTDAQLQAVLALHRPAKIELPASTSWALKEAAPGGGHAVPQQVPRNLQQLAGGPRPSSARPHFQRVIAGPRLKVPAAVLAQFGVGFVSGKGPREFIRGNPPWSRASLLSNCSAFLPRTAARRP